MFSQEMVFSGVTKSETNETSQDFLKSDGWRKIVTQVESALCREDRSRQALDQLQQLAVEQGASTQFLLKSVIRETIRLTLECFGDCFDEASDLFKRSEAATPPLQSEVLPPAPVPLVLTPQQKEAQEDAAVFTSIARILHPTPPVTTLRDRLRPPTPIATPQQPTQTREESLLALCHAFRQHRSRLNLSLKQIHASTFIPLHHLQSLEENKLDRLPEDVYLRGFLRRLDQCFNLTDGQLIHHLPVVKIERSPLSTPTTSRPTSTSPHSPNYAYIAYAALMAGGMTWIAQQGSPKSNLPSIKIDTPVSGPQNAPQKVSSQQVQQTQTALHQNVAHPESFA